MSPAVAAAATPSLSRPLTFLRTHNLWNSATKEVLGANIPHVVLVQCMNEAIDQGIIQFGNTLAVFGGGALADKAFDRLSLGRRPKQALTQLNTTQRQWYNLGKSAAIFSLLIGYVQASPFLRNWATAKRTHTTNYVDMVGVNGTTPTHLEDGAAVQQQEQRYLSRFFKVLGGAAAISATVWGATQAALKTSPRFPKTLARLTQPFTLPGGRYNQFTDLQTYLFWAIPTYMGLLAGSRDSVERKEVWVRTLGFGLAFLVLPRTLEHWVARAAKGRHFPVVGPGSNLAFVAQLISAIIFYTSIPTISNLVLRKDRAKRAGLLKEPALDPASTKLSTHLGPSLQGQDPLAAQVLSPSLRA